MLMDSTIHNDRETVVPELWVKFDWIYNRLCYISLIFIRNFTDVDEYETQNHTTKV